MITIDLLPPEEARAAAALRRARRIATAGAGVTALILVLAHGALEIATVETQREILRADADRVSLERPVATLRQLRRRQAAVRRRLAVIEQLEGRVPSPVRFLEGLVAATPARLWLTEVTLANGRVVLSGRAADDRTIADFVGRLREATRLDGLDLDEAERETADPEPSRRFVIAGRLEEHR